MLPAAPGGWLYPAKLSAALPKYRELLRTRSTSNSGGMDESSSLFQQAKERVLARAAARRAAVSRVDPRRAFGRVQERWAATRLRLRDLKNEQKERLRQYVATAVGGSKALDSSIINSSSSSSKGSAGISHTAGRSSAELAGAQQAAVTQQAAATQQTASPEAVEAQGALDAEAAAAVMGADGPLRHLVLAGVGGACKLFLSAGARTSVSGQEHMVAALGRAPTRGLITVSNHVGAIDDPLVTASIVPAGTLLEPGAVRWTLCATDRCFRSAALAPFFRAAKVLPVERGAGLGQFGMRLAQSRLLEGQWVHVFPEGTRSRDGRMLPVRKGVGWLVASAVAAGGEPPLVLPFVHSGMEKIMPKGSALPKLGQELRVLVGEPVAVEDLLAAAVAQGWAEQRLQAAIADRVGQAMYSLKARLDGLPLEEVAPQPRAAAISISEDTLLPLIEDEMDSLAHRWHDGWQRLSLPSITQQVRQEAASRRAMLRSGGVFGADATFEEIAAATEEAAGLMSGWEHAGGAPAPWSAALSAAAVGHAGGAAAAWNAAAPASGTQPLLLLRQKLRLLRGGALSGASAPLSADAGSSGSSVDATTTPSSSNGSRAALAAAASPLDLVAARASADGASGGRLAALLAVAAGYSAARMAHMRELLLPADAAASGSPAAA